jgi:GrpB-like predicted nucleotidyltransferase (UPF0157 family)
MTANLLLPPRPRSIGNRHSRLSRPLEWSAVDGPERIVEVVDSDPSWPEAFESERRLLADVLPIASSIEHIGSTSVPGLAAKPIIDIMAVVPEAGAVAEDVSALERLGYVFRQWAFADDEQHLFFVKDADGRRSHHLHVFTAASPKAYENRVFRGYLATHPDAARRYEAAKRQAADMHPDSRARYGAAKEAVMREVMAEARRWAR